MTIVTFDDLFRATLWLFLVIFVQKVCETNLNFSYQRVIRKNKSTLIMYTFEIDIQKVPLYL